jgi:type I restriction enzyme, S subunit
MNGLTMVTTSNPLEIEFPEDWEIVTLDTLFKIKQGKQLSQKNQTGLSSHPFLRTSNVFWKKIKLKKLDKMDFNPDEIQNLQLKNKDLLVCEGGDIGRTAIWNEEIPLCFYQNHLHRLRAKSEDVSPEFYMYWMEAALLILNLYKGKGNKTTIANLSKSRLSSYLVPKLDFDEQTKISSILSDCSETIQSYEKILSTLNELSKSLMNKFFTKGLNGGDSKDSEIGKIPKEWDLLRIDDCYAQELKNGIYKESKFFDKGDSQIIELGNLYSSEREIVVNNLRNIELTNEEISKYHIHDEDVIINRVSKQKEGVGQARIIRIPKETVIPIVFESNMFRVRFDQHKISSDYFSFFSQSEKYFNQVQSKGLKGNQTSIKQSAIGSVKIPVPKDDQEKNEIILTLKSMENLRNNTNLRKTTAENLYKSLLQKLMTGTIRVLK